MADDDAAGDPFAPVPETPAHEVARRVVGLSEHAARELVLDNAMVLRIVGRDGQSWPITMDYRTNRVNVTLVDGHVVSSRVG